MKTNTFNNVVFYPAIMTPVGSTPIIGRTMTDEREREIAQASALRDMPRLGLDPVEANLGRYFAMIREVLE